MVILDVELGLLSLVLNQPSVLIDEVLPGNEITLVGWVTQKARNAASMERAAVMVFQPLCIQIVGDLPRAVSICCHLKHLDHQRRILIRIEFAIRPFGIAHATLELARRAAFVVLLL